MKSTKMFLMLTIFTGLSIVSGDSNAQKYNALIKNPFAFCSAPKPCKTCHPFRQIYEDICDGNKPVQIILPSTDLTSPGAPQSIQILPSSEIPKPVLPPVPLTEKEIENEITKNVK